MLLLSFYVVEISAALDMTANTLICITLVGIFITSVNIPAQVAKNNFICHRNI
jgi:hypothetical protein